MANAPKITKRQKGLRIDLELDAKVLAQKTKMIRPRIFALLKRLLARLNSLRRHTKRLQRGKGLTKPNAVASNKERKM